MSIERWLGSWDLLPTNGNTDVLCQLWHYLAAQNVGTPYQQNNSGLSQRRGEITMLWELYRRVKPKVVLEIGVAQGGTFASWCYLGEPDATIIGIDRDVNDCRPRHNDPVHQFISMPGEHKTTTQGGGMMHLKRHQQRIVPINGWSYAPHVLEEVRLTLGDKKVDWLFHDASHSADMARRDYELYRPFMAEGSVMAFHDIQESQVPECNKSEWWRSVRENGDYSALMEFRGPRTADSMGIGLIIL